MKQFNITAQVYEILDPHKQTLLINQIVESVSIDDAEKEFQLFFDIINHEYKLVRIFSIEEISQVAV